MEAELAKDIVTEKNIPDKKAEDVEQLVVELKKLLVPFWEL